MSNEEILDRIIDVMDSYNYFDQGFDLSDIIVDIVSLFDESNDIVVGILEELYYINDLVNEDNFFDIGRKLEVLRDNLVNMDIPKIVTDKNLVLGKVLDGLKDTSMRFELDMIIRETLAR